MECPDKLEPQYLTSVLKNVPVDMMNEQGTMPTGNAVDVIRQLKKEKDEDEEVK